MYNFIQKIGYTEYDSNYFIKEMNKVNNRTEMSRKHAWNIEDIYGPEEVHSLS